MERKSQVLPLILYGNVRGELRPQARIVLLRFPLGTDARNREIRKAAKVVGPKELAAQFGLSVPQVWRIIRGVTSGKKWRGEKKGRSKPLAR